MGRGRADRKRTFVFLVKELLLFLTMLAAQHLTHSTEYSTFPKFERLLPRVTSRDMMNSKTIVKFLSFGHVWNLSWSVNLMD